MLLAANAAGWLGTKLVLPGLLDITTDEGKGLFSIIIIVFVPVVCALVWVIHRLKKRLKTIPPEQPYRQKRILRHLQKIAGVQALIGLALATIVIQMEVGPIESQFLTLSVFWSGAALFYFVAYSYQLRIEEELKSNGA